MELSVYVALAVLSEVMNSRAKFSFLVTKLFDVDATKLKFYLISIMDLLLTGRCAFFTDTSRSTRISAPLLFISLFNKFKFGHFNLISFTYNRIIQIPGLRMRH